MARQFGAIGRSVYKNKKNPIQSFFLLSLEIRVGRSVKKNCEESVFLGAMSPNTMECL